MTELVTLLFMIALSYAMGVLWYSIFHIRHDGWMRMAAFPFIAIVAGEGLWAPFYAAGPVFLGVHIMAAFILALIAVLVDLVVYTLWRRTGRPTLEVTPAHA